ncbi:MAG TPA: hypothetical protein VMD97_05420 [Candidatus Aquilonibacter sp.]|nr:hypothetical protein [Candidatus Aquilonibacter sp.]
MRVLLFGATGMVGHGVLSECLTASDVTEVVAVVRSPLLRIPALKLIEVQHRDFFNWSDVDLHGFDACFFALGVSSLGMSKPDYRHVTFDLTMALAHPLVQASPQAVFVYVSGAGTDANGRRMWARVKGETEDALMALPFRGVYCFRPGYIQPLNGVRSKVDWYNGFYAALAWTYPLLRRMMPSLVTSTRAVGRAMLQVARCGWPTRVLETRDINAAAEKQTGG